MEFDGMMHAIGLLFQVFLLDLILSGDNAVVIALACRSLPILQRRKVILIGTSAAIALRVILTLVVTSLLSIPSLKLLGAVTLMYIAFKLMLEKNDQDGDVEDLHVNPDPEKQFWSAVSVVVLADLVMSLDNVVALAAVAQGNILFLVLGLLLSVPLLMVGSLFISNLINRYAILVPIVGALLGWIAGDIGVSDPLIADWVNTQSPALTVIVPLFCAIYVLLQSTLLKKKRAKRENEHPQSPVLPTLATMLAPIPALAQGIRTNTPTNTPIDIPVNIPAASPLVTTPSFASALNTRRVIIGGICSVVVGIISLFFFSRGTSSSTLQQYDCPGFSGPFSLYYHQGEEHIQLRAGWYEVDGKIRYGHIEWEHAPSEMLGFAPPDEISGDDGHSIKINGGNFVKISCQAAP